MGALGLAGCGFLVWRLIGPPGRGLWRFTSLSLAAVLITAWAVAYSVHRPALPDVVRDTRGHLVGFIDYNDPDPDLARCSPHPGMMRGASEVGSLHVAYNRDLKEWVGTLGRSGTLPVYRSAPMVSKMTDPSGTTIGPAVRRLFVVSLDGCQIWVNPGTVGV
jgi:hypothetical protein